MKVIVLAERFVDGSWTDWEHLCDQPELEAVIDSANAKAADNMRSQPSYRDYLAGVAYTFNIACGAPDTPQIGDTRVYAVIVNGMLIGNSDKVQLHFLASRLAG